MFCVCTAGYGDICLSFLLLLAYRPVQPASNLYERAGPSGRGQFGVEGYGIILLFFWPFQLTIEHGMSPGELLARCASDSICRASLDRYRAQAPHKHDKQQLKYYSYRLDPLAGRQV